jgi:ABC-type phosphate/phosphonate transport system substrate-binding protein
MKSIIKFSAVVLLVSMFAACNEKPKKEAKKDEGFEETAFMPCCGEPSSNEKLLTIDLALNDTYCKKTACACIHDIAAREYEELQKQLLEQFNIDLKITYYMEPYIMEDQLRAKTHDGVITKPWNAFMLTKNNDLRYERVADILDVYDNQWLTGVYLVRKDSPIKTMADIAGKTLVAGQEDAYEKYHAPFHQLNGLNIKPGKVYHKASCLESINELMDNNADVAIVSDYVMSASCAVDVASEEDFRVIGETEKMPLCSVVIDRKKISKEDAMRFQKALLALSKDKSPEGMLSAGFVKPASWIPNPYKKPIAQN